VNPNAQRSTLNIQLLGWFIGPMRDGTIVAALHEPRKGTSEATLWPSAEWGVRSAEWKHLRFMSPGQFKKEQAASREPMGVERWALNVER
jgi:hypothetical protein